MGRVYQATYTMLDKATDLRVKRTTPAWYIEYTNSTGRCVRRKAGLTKDAAKDALRKAESDVLAEKNGLPTRGASGIPALELCERFLKSLRTRASEAHCKWTDAYVREVLGNCRIHTVIDLVPERVEVYLDSLATEKDLGAIAINSRLHCLNAMLNWAVRARMIPYNPLDCIAPREKLHRRHRRRALTEIEIARMLAAALEGPLRRKKRIYQNRPRKDGSFKHADISLARQACLAVRGAEQCSGVSLDARGRLAKKRNDIGDVERY